MLTSVLFALISGTAQPPALAAAAFTRPASIGVPHLCAETQYPVSALQTGTEGQTILKFTITKDGRVADISVRTSSGNVDLDAVSMSCARDWLYRPAMQDGAPIDVPWLAAVRWQIGVTAPYAAMDAQSLRCMRADTVTIDELKKAPLHAVMRVHFANGAINEATIVGTSGDADLDSRVASCYRGVPPELTANAPDGDQLFVAMLPQVSENQP
jgi:TonB family protein